MSKLRHSLLAFAALSYSATAAPMTVRLLPGVSSPQPVGTPIGLVPHVDDAVPGMLVFRYSVTLDRASSIIRDFSQQRDFVWTPALTEHEATIHLTVRNNRTKETADAELPFRIV